MGFCPANCADPEFIPIPDAGCEVKRRKRGLYKIGFYACSTSLPTPLTCDALEALVDSNTVVFSNALVNVEWADVEMEDVVIADCLPAAQEAIGRQLTFEDHIAVDVPDTASGGANPFADLKFWGNLNKYKYSLRYLFVWCDGVVEMPLDINGNPMAATFDVRRNFVRQGTGGTSYTLEIKRGMINFKGDPLELREDYEPALIIDGAECASLAQKLGLSQVA